MPRYKITIEYKGTDFAGWQRQEHALSVQQVIEEAIESFYGTKVVIFGSGRTDAGVHALMQVAHFDLAKDIPEHKIISAINHFVKPHDIVIHKCEIVDENFNARFDAKKRSYIYKILNQPYPSSTLKGLVWHVAQKLDHIKMHDAAQVLIGRHDFTSFRSTHCQSKNPVKSIDSISVELNKNIIEIHISAPSFMHNQVRIIAGCLVDVGLGKWDTDSLHSVLKAKDRTKAAKTAPPTGLYLSNIEF